MDGHDHYLEGEHQLRLADGKPTYSEAAAQHVERATSHFTAALAWSALWTEVPEPDAVPLCDGSCGQQAPHHVHFEPLA